MMKAALLLATTLVAMPVARAQTPPEPASPSARTHAHLPHALTLPFEHVEGRLAYVHAELAITEAQAPQWDAFAAAARDGAAEMRAQYDKLAGTGLPSAAPDRARALLDMLAARLDAARKTVEAGTALYAVLTPEQKRIADQLLAGPLGRL